MRQSKKLDGGNIVRLPMTDGESCYGVILGFPLIGFFDIKSSKQLEPDEILDRPMLFKVWVMKSPISSGRWPVIGHIELSHEMMQPTWFYKKDPIDGTLSIVGSGKNIPLEIKQERSASAPECRGLEAAAVWSAEHVEERLRDHFDGTPNRFVEHFKKMT